MLEQLLASLKGQISGELQQKAGVDSSMIDDVIKVAGQSAAEEVGKEMISGHLGSVMNLFSEKDNSSEANSLQTNITNSVVGSLITKLGFNKDTANSISGIILPAIMSVITKKNGETPENDSSPLESIFGEVLGGGNKKSGGLGGLLGGLGGLLGKK